MALETDEAELLKLYSLDTLTPTRWASSAASASGAPLALLPDEPDALGLRGPHVEATSRALAPDVRAQVLLASKAFDAKLYLSTLHPDATFADLSRAVQHLEESMAQRSEALKVLVQDNFDRFVAVKATTDGVFREMRDGAAGPLRPDADYGTAQLKAILAQASAKADQVFMPVLENNLKAAKLRSTLGVFERSRFFFNLPGSLGEAVAAERWDVALRDYKKGKYLLDARPGQLLAFNTADGSKGNAKQQAQQRRVFNKVWDAVEETMREMRERLVALLREPKRGVEEQERTIE
jgi:exocyst complex component 2